jgi:hypothetical protein
MSRIVVLLLGSSWSGWSSIGGVATSGPVAITRDGI